MVRRRTVLTAAVGVAAVGAGLITTDRLDDTLRAVGARPKPAPDRRDLMLIRSARNDQADLIALAAKHKDPAVIEVLREQSRGLGGTNAASSAPRNGDSLAVAIQRVIEARHDDALAARSAEVAAVLASLSAGLVQVSATLARAS